MFRAHPAHHQEFNDASCTYAASSIVTLCDTPCLVQPLRKDCPSLAVAQDSHLQRVTIPEAT